MHYKTRTYLNEAVIVKSTGCDMNEVWSMYLKIEKCRVTRQHVICELKMGDNDSWESN